MQSATERFTRDIEALRVKYKQDVRERTEAFLNETNEPVVFEPQKQEEKKTVQKKQPPKEKEEADDDDVFVVDDDEDPEYYNSDDDEDAPPSLHSHMKPMSKKRTDRSYSDEEDQEEEDEEEDLNPDVPTKYDEDAWRLIKGKSWSAQKRNPWFRKRYYDGLERVRDNLGHQSNNAEPRALFDQMAISPDHWRFNDISPGKYGLCAGCNYKKSCTLAGITMGGANRFFGDRCGGLAQAWCAFHTARIEQAPLKELDRLYANILKAQASKAVKKSKK